LTSDNVNQQMTVTLATEYVNQHKRITTSLVMLIKVAR